MREFDIVHFNFGDSILPKARFPKKRLPVNKRDRAYRLYTETLELRYLPLLKMANKGIVVTYQGDDARQGDYSRANFAISIANEVGNDYYSDETDQWKRARIAKFGAYADRIFALNPDLLHVLPPHTGIHALWPYRSARKWHPIVKPLNPEQPPVVLHAPSHRGAKGTRFVMDAMAAYR